jgi:PknH-like extracellular domain
MERPPLALPVYASWLRGAVATISPMPRNSAISTTTTPTAQPLDTCALPNLLLNPEQVNVAMAAADMAVTTTHFEMSDDSATMEPRECLAIDGAAQAQVYAGSGVTAERDQTLKQGDDFTDYALPAAVLFPSAEKAEAFYEASAQQWPACQHYTHLQSGSAWDVAPISNTDGMLSTIATQQNAQEGGWVCGRALTVRNNVVVDVNTCSANPADSAVKIATRSPRMWIPHSPIRSRPPATPPTLTGSTSAFRCSTLPGTKLSRDRGRPRVLSRTVRGARPVVLEFAHRVDIRPCHSCCSSGWTTATSRPVMSATLLVWAKRQGWF